MTERRLPRLLLEVGFLAALAAALAFASLRPLEIAGLAALGWLLTAVFEWGALQRRPHFGCGLPPRYRLPRVALPPSRPLEQFGAGYPAPPSVADEPTWIASPSMLAEWPVVEPGPPQPAPTAAADEETRVHDVLEEELAFALAERMQEAVPVEEPDDAPLVEDALELSEEREPARAEPPVRPARHRIDPLAEPPRPRRFGRRAAVEVAYAEVPARPQPTRPLPTQGREPE